MNAYHGQSSVTSISAAGLGALQRRAQSGRAAAAALAARGRDACSSSGTAARQDRTGRRTASRP